MQRLLWAVLLSLFVVASILADTPPSYSEILRQEHAKFIEQVQNPHNNNEESSWSVSKHGKTIAVLGLNLFALNVSFYLTQNLTLKKLYSVEAQKLVSNINSYI